MDVCKLICSTQFSAISACVKKEIVSVYNKKNSGYERFQ